MNILWITNTVFPEATALLTGNKNDLKSSGGWMVAGAASLVSDENIRLAVASIANIDKLIHLQGNKIDYYLIPKGAGNNHINHDYEAYFKRICDEFRPDVTHIHGTEFSHGLAFVEACGAEHVVVSIQGICNEIGNHYLDGLSYKDVIKNITIRDIIKGTLFAEKKSWLKRGEYERAILKKVKHVIGRTEWDHAFVWAVNNKIKYHKCNETLRPEFYSDHWQYDKCRPHTIFVSQAYYPIKGLHQLIKALPMILREYSDVKVRIAGNNVLEYGIKHRTSYFQYLRTLIQKNKLHDCIHFCGVLSAEEMKQEYLLANVFVCPSSIENSSNALCEAVLLGVPVLASHVGGLPSMMEGQLQNLYRFDDVELLASKICNVFANEENQSNCIDIARKRHNAETNTNTLLDIYKMITK